MFYVLNLCTHSFLSIEIRFGTWILSDPSSEDKNQISQITYDAVTHTPGTGTGYFFLHTPKSL